MMLAKIFVCGLVCGLMMLTTPVIATAVAPPAVAFSAAYNQGQGKYDVVIKAPAKGRITLYLNGKKAATTVAGKTGWATFRKVALGGKGKMTFSITAKKNASKTFEQMLGYVRYYEVKNNKLGTSSKPIEPPKPVAPKAAVVPPPSVQTKVVAPAPAPTPVPSPVAPVPAPQPAPAEAYYANCTAARAAGVAPIYRGQPGYRPALDRDDDGIACET